MTNKKNSKWWVALLAGLYVGIWVLAAAMNWPVVLNIMAALTAALAAGGLVALILRGRAASQKRKQEREKRAQENAAAVATRGVRQAATPKKSYGPEIDPIIQEGNRALSEMGRLYTSIKDPAVRQKINEIMRITDKITQDAIADPSDIPQIRKFMNYYLPTTIKLLNAYDRMSAQGIQGDNVGKSMKNINEMLDAAIVAYRKRLDSLFENQALDIETDIEVMNTMLAREGLSGTKDFDIATERKSST